MNPRDSWNDFYARSKFLCRVYEFWASSWRKKIVCPLNWKLIHNASTMGSLPWIYQTRAMKKQIRTISIFFSMRRYSASECYSTATNSCNKSRQVFFSNSRKYRMWWQNHNEWYAFLSMFEVKYHVLKRTRNCTDKLPLTIKYKPVYIEHERTMEWNQHKMASNDRRVDQTNRVMDFYRTKKLFTIHSVYPLNNMLKKMSKTKIFHLFFSIIKK